MKFCDKLAKTRKANNLSQEQLADELGVTRQSVSKWESGDSYPDMAKIIQLCKVLNCTINDILDDDVVSNKIKEETNETTDPNKVNILKKYFNELLEFMTKSINMISHMSFIQILKMIIELVLLGIALYFLSGIINWAVEEFLWNILSYVPKIYEVIRIILSTILIAGEMIFSAIITIHSYRVRYLDYYVTLTDNNATKQTVEEPIEENKATAFSNKKNEKIVIIRDPKHSNSKVIDGLVSAIVFVCKVVVVLFSLPVIFGLISSTAGLIICLIRQGYIFKSSLPICLGILILSVTILMFFYNILFNRKQKHILNIVLLVISLVLGGIGCGLLVNTIPNLTFVDNNSEVETISKQIILSNLNDKDTIYFDSYDIGFTLDENRKDILIEMEYPKDVQLNENKYQDEDGIEYHYHISTNELFEFKEFLNDIEHNIISDSYDLESYFKVNITCNSVNKQKIAQLAQ